MDFPNSPTNGQMFTSGGTTWYYDSSIPAWTGGAVGGAMVVLAPAYAASVTVDLTNYVLYPIVVVNITLGGPLTFNISNGTDGQIIRVRFLQDGGGNRLFTAGSNIRFSVDTPSLVLSTGANKLDRAAFEWHSSGKADLIAVNKTY